MKYVLKVYVRKFTERREEVEEAGRKEMYAYSWEDGSEVVYMWTMWMSFEKKIVCVGFLAGGEKLVPVLVTCDGRG